MSAAKEYIPLTSRPPASAPENLRPEINLNLVESGEKREPFRHPAIIGNRRKRPTLESRVWGNAPFFSNAKPTSMKERGWRRSEMDTLQPGKKGLLVENDGPEIEVTVLQNYDENHMYKFVDASGKIYDKYYSGRYDEWDFYIPIPAAPFKPMRRGGYKKTRKSKNRSTRKRK